MARLSGLNLTGSLGILIKAKQHGFPLVIADAVPIATLDGGLVQAEKSFKVKHWQP